MKDSPRWARRARRFQPARTAAAGSVVQGPAWAAVRRAGRTGRGSGKRAASQGRRRAAAGLTVPRMARWRERVTAADSDSIRPRPGQAPRRRTAARRTAAWTAAAVGGCARGAQRLRRQAEPSGSGSRRRLGCMRRDGCNAGLRRPAGRAWEGCGVRCARAAGWPWAVWTLEDAAYAPWQYGLSVKSAVCWERPFILARIGLYFERPGIGWEVGVVEAARSHRA